MSFYDDDNTVPMMQAQEGAQEGETQPAGVSYVIEDICPYCRYVLFFDGCGYKVCSQCGYREPC